VEIFLDTANIEEIREAANVNLTHHVLERR